MKKSLLSFSPSSPREIPPGPRIPIKHPQCPSQSSQVRRLSPIFQSLQNAMERKAAVLQQDVQGVDPDFVHPAGFYALSRRLKLLEGCGFRE